MSGDGSNLAQTKNIRRELATRIKEFGCQTVLDAPCGDWCWKKEVELPLLEYIEADIVADLIEESQREYSCETKTSPFLTLHENDCQESISSYAATVSFTCNCRQRSTPSVTWLGVGRSTLRPPHIRVSCAETRIALSQEIGGRSISKRPRFRCGRRFA